MRFSGIVRASLVLAAFMAANARSIRRCSRINREEWRGGIKWLDFGPARSTWTRVPARWLRKASRLPKRLLHQTTCFTGAKEHRDSQLTNTTDTMTTRKFWWETQSDSTGFASLFISSDGLTYEGVPALGPPFGNDTSRYRETYSIGADGTFDETVTRLLGGTWHPFNEASCKRVTGGTRSTLSDSGGIGPRTTTHHV